MWCEDEAGPFQAIPQPGRSWQLESHPARIPHEYIRGGTAKVLTLFHPQDGKIRIKGVESCTNAVMHPWMKTQFTAILKHSPVTPEQKKQQHMSQIQRNAIWERWQDGLQIKFTLPEKLPPLRILLILDNLSGHKTPEMVLWWVYHGVMPIYTPISGSWLNMAESIQNILKARALAGAIPKSPQDLIDYFEQVAHAWKHNPTPFVWGGKRAIRRQRSRERRHALSGSGATSKLPISRSRSKGCLLQWPSPSHLTH